MPGGFELILEGDTGTEAEDFHTPPWPKDFPARLGRLEDLSGTSLEEFARAFGLPEEWAREWRSGTMPTTDEVWAMTLWADQVPSGNAVLLAPFRVLVFRGVGQWDASSSGLPRGAGGVPGAPGGVRRGRRADLARAGARLKVNARTVRWWKAGAKPSSGHLVNLFDLAAGMGLLHLLLPSVSESEAAEAEETPVTQG